jgi:hypothetical protein
MNPLMSLLLGWDLILIRSSGRVGLQLGPLLTSLLLLLGLGIGLAVRGKGDPKENRKFVIHSSQFLPVIDEVWEK